MTENGQLLLFADEETRGRATRKGKTGKDFGDYEGFVEKFKPKKTTDDCYTPPEVYEAVRKFVNDHVMPLDGREIVRPFFPGGDYARHEYPEGCVVIDNPPFSILARIVRFYCGSGIPFFLFAPALTLFVAKEREELTYVVAAADVTYENRAVVRTGFVTNMTPGLRVWVCPGLKEAVDAAQRKPELMPMRKNAFDPHVVTPSTLQKLSAQGVSLKIRSESCRAVNEVNGYNLFGGGFLLSDRAAAERAAAERAAAERAAAFKVAPSDRERRIIEMLNENEKDKPTNIES